MAQNNRAMQRFFECVLNVPGDCFCCTWSIACFLETVEHMDGDRKWRSVCALGMTILSFIIIFLLCVSLCPQYYWSEINEIILFNDTQSSLHNYSNDGHILYTIDDTNYAAYYFTFNNDLIDQNDSKVRFSQHFDLSLNLWHLQKCVRNYTNITIFNNDDNNGRQLLALNSDSNYDLFTTIYHSISQLFTFESSPATVINSVTNNGVSFNSTIIETNRTCHIESYNTTGTSSTQQLSLWFIILVIILLLFASCCICCTHPWFDHTHTSDDSLRNCTSKLLACSITFLCACILNWSSFVFAAVIEQETENYDDNSRKELSTMSPSNLGTGMLAVNGGMLLGIILSVVHCGAPTRHRGGRRGRRRGGTGVAAAANNLVGAANPVNANANNPIIDDSSSVAANNRDRNDIASQSNASVNIDNFDIGGSISINRRLRSNDANDNVADSVNNDRSIALLDGGVNVIGSGNNNSGVQTSYQILEEKESDDEFVRRTVLDTNALMESQTTTTAVVSSASHISDDTVVTSHSQLSNGGSGDGSNIDDVSSQNHSNVSWHNSLSSIGARFGRFMSRNGATTSAAAVNLLSGTNGANDDTSINRDDTSNIRLVLNSNASEAEITGAALRSSSGDSDLSANHRTTTMASQQLF